MIELAKGATVKATMKFRWFRATKEEIDQHPTVLFADLPKARLSHYILKQEILVGNQEPIWHTISIQEED